MNTPLQRHFFLCDMPVEHSSDCLQGIGHGTFPFLIIVHTGKRYTAEQSVRFSFSGGRNSMINLTATDLTGTGLTEAEMRGVLSRTGDKNLIQLLRRSRSRQLEEIHVRQQALDRLDYLIHKLRTEL